MLVSIPKPNFFGDLNFLNYFQKENLTLKMLDSFMYTFNAMAVRKGFSCLNEIFLIIRFNDFV